MPILIVMAACFISRVRATKLSPNCWICHLLFFSYIVPVRNFCPFFVLLFWGWEEIKLGPVVRIVCSICHQFLCCPCLFPPFFFFFCVCLLFVERKSSLAQMSDLFFSICHQLGRLLQFSVKWCDTTYARKQSNIIRKKDHQITVERKL